MVLPTGGNIGPRVLLGAVSYPTSHIFESWTQYGSLTQGVSSLMLVYLTFFPAGLIRLQRSLSQHFVTSESR